MSDGRQKNQLVLAFVEEKGEAPKGLGEGTESLAAKRRTESPALGERLMEEVCEREAMMRVLQRRRDRTFSDHSYGSRPGRSAHQAVAQAQQSIAKGCRGVVDLEKFLDTASYCPLVHESCSNNAGC